MNKKVLAKDIISNIFMYLLVIGLCFSILYPLLSLIPKVFSKISELGNPNVIWIPEKFSTVSFKAAARFIMPKGIRTFLLSVGYAALMMAVEVFFSAMVGYSLARVDSVVNRIVFFLVILVFLVPRQSLLLSQYIYFKHFDVLGIMNIFTSKGEVDLIGNPLVLFLFSIFGFGVNQSLFIYIFSQFFKNIPKEMEEASQIDGYGFFKTYFLIMLPNAVPVISTVSILSFVWNYGDVYYTNYFSPTIKFMSNLLSTTFIGSNKNYVLNAIQKWFSVPAINDIAFDAVREAGALIYLVPLLVVFFIGQRKLVQNLESSGLVG